MEKEKNTEPKNQKTDAFGEEFLETLKKSSEDEDKSFWIHY